MAHNVDIGGVTYVPANVAGSTVGYSSDYVARLAREKKIAAKQIGRQWFVDPISLENFYADANRKKKDRQERLRKERITERRQNSAKNIALGTNAAHGRLDTHDIRGLYGTRFFVAANTPTVVEAMKNASTFGAFMKSSGVMLAGVMFAVLLHSGIAVPVPSTQVASIGETLTGVAGKLHGAMQGQLALFDFLRIKNNAVEKTNTVDMADRTQQSEDVSQGQRDTAPMGGDGEGVIIVEDSPMAAKTLDDLARSFSDEVQIERDDENPQSGVITPIFREQKHGTNGDRYRFLMVPVAEGSGP